MAKLRKWEQDLEAAVVQVGTSAEVVDVGAGEAADLGSAGDVSDDTPSRPGPTALVAAWRDYATALGIDHEGLTRTEIIAAIDQI